MSLKAFHLVFVIASILLGLGVGGWGIMEYRSNGEISALIMGLIFLIMGVTLTIYGNRMLKKTKHIGYLTLLLIFGLKQNTLACAACYGESDSPMAEGMNAGIFVLLIIIGGTLAAIAGFFLFIMRRARIQAARDKLLRDPKLIGIRTLDLSKNTSLPRQII
jgi:hypothetical protein